MVKVINNPIPVFENKRWDLLEEYRDVKIEINNKTDVARLINSKNKLVAYGELNEIKRAYDRIHYPWRNCNIGDIVSVGRNNGLYYHYAIYIGSGMVIHYAPPEGGNAKSACIHKANFRVFLDGAISYEILTFLDKGNIPQRTEVNLITGNGKERRFSRKDMALLNEFFLNHKKMNIYSLSETVKRARNRLGEKKYNLATNNCEHFALWCKTGIQESTQVDLAMENIIFFAWRL